jgi:sulfur carrier protein ThiS
MITRVQQVIKQTRLRRHGAAFSKNGIFAPESS